MYNNIQINHGFLVKVLFILSVVSEVHPHNLTNVNIMKERFQQVLMNDDGEQILTLQRIFIFPRSADGLCLTVNVLVEFEQSGITDPSVQCNMGIREANSCSYTLGFELSSATDLAKALSSPAVEKVLALLDLLIYTSLQLGLSSFYDNTEYYSIKFRVQLDGIDSLYGIYSDVIDAIHSTLSWVS